MSDPEAWPVSACNLYAAAYTLQPVDLAALSDQDLESLNDALFRAHLLLGLERADRKKRERQETTP